ncbi:MAG: hypothetical protein JNG90_17000 [Planctomycetaceae bacterium]|nr:hypothetical protein [Planctomycetaceae bacterium]
MRLGVEQSLRLARLCAWVLGVCLAVASSVPRLQAFAQEREELRPRPISLVEQWPLEIPAHHVQGLAVTPENFWISSVDRGQRKGWVFRIDRRTSKIVAARDVTLGAQYHPGGMQVVRDGLWVPVAEYRPKSTTTVLKLDPQTLETLSSFAVDDHLGATACDGESTVWGVNWDSRQVYFFDLAGKLKEKRDNPTGVAYQDLDYWDGLLFGCGATQVDDHRLAVVDGLDPKSCALQTRYELRGETRSGNNNFSREGFAKLDGDFYLLPEDGPASTVYRFALPQQ